MPVSCSAYGCTNRHITGGSIQFFGFPLKNEGLLELWLKATKRKNFIPTRFSKICNEHFVETDFLIRPGTYVRHLKPDAVPSIFTGFPKYYQTSKKMRLANAATRSLRNKDEPCCSKELMPRTERYELDVRKTLEKAVQTDTSASISLLKTKIKTLQQQVRRQKLNISSMKAFVNGLKNRGLLESEVRDLLLNQFEGLSLELINSELSNVEKHPHGRRYTQEMKRFAVALHYHSPKAFKFCRTVLNLPHPSAISNWTSSVEAEPGFFKEVFSALSKLPPEDKDCSLVLDGMAIRKQLIWDRGLKKILGYCEFGSDMFLEESETEATEALVFMLVSLRGKWKWPIGYVLQNKSKAMVQCQLINTALQLSSEAGLKVWNVTCDGTATNFATMKNLGVRGMDANFNDMQTKISLSNRNENIYFIPDACHMLKLTRNTFASLNEIHTPNGTIYWNLIETLLHLQEDIGLKFGTKLSKSHIEWEKNKMKVKFAAQVLSSSTADAMVFLKQMEEPKFLQCDETVRFLRTIDRLFDFLNSRNPFSKGCKKPVYFDNILDLEKEIVPLIEYLYELRDGKNNFIHRSNKKTFIIGFSAAVKSVFSIAKELLTNSYFKYLLTYKFSQDHIELLFARIRRRLGYNNNPNVVQFKTAMKQIILKNAISASTAANCIALDDDPVGGIIDIQWTFRKRNNISYNDLEDDFKDVPHYDRDNVLKDNILYYIGGFIVRSLIKKIHCINCVEALSIRSTNSDHNYSHKFHFSIMTQV